MDLAEEVERLVEDRLRQLPAGLGAARGREARLEPRPVDEDGVAARHGERAALGGERARAIRGRVEGDDDRGPGRAGEEPIERLRAGDGVPSPPAARRDHPVGA
jgi:hypothetical protein